MTDVIICGLRFEWRPDGVLLRRNEYSTIGVECAPRRPGESETWVAWLKWEVGGYAEEFGDTAEEALEELLDNSREFAAGLVRDLRADMPEAPAPDAAEVSARSATILLDPDVPEAEIDTELRRMGLDPEKLREAGRRIAANLEKTK